MKKTIFNIIAIVMIAMLSSCSQRIIGTWAVQRYEVTNPGQQGITLSNIGTMEFSKNGTGKKNLDYSVLGLHKHDEVSFKWNWTDGKYMSIESAGSDFSKTWIIIENKRKYQKWQSTDGQNKVQILELKK